MKSRNHCCIINKSGDVGGWEHKWKVIYQERGKIHNLFYKKDIWIYHVQCERCGRLDDFRLLLPCQKCREFDFKKMIKKNERMLK